jgi:hypothetical protein
MIVSLQDSGIKTILQYIHHYQFIIKGPKCCACQFPKHDISIKNVGYLNYIIKKVEAVQPRPQGLLRTWRVKNEKTLVKAVLNSVVIGLYI